MTFVKCKLRNFTTNFYFLFLKTSGKNFGVSVPGIGHSDIRGLVTYRSMVRRGLYRLNAWITDICAYIVEA